MHGPAGFASSNVSKGFLLTSGIFSIVALWTRKTGLFGLDLEPTFGRGQLWRLFTHVFVWSSSSELLLGSILLYTWRLFERQFGTRKFGGCLAFLAVGSTLLQLVVLAVSRTIPGGREWTFSSGPYGIAFGLLAVFAWDIPPTAPFTLFGFLPLSDKIFVYTLAAQLACSNLPGSAYTALIGLILGTLYRTEWLPFHRLRIPQAVVNACGTVFSPLLSGSLLATIAGVNDAQGRRLGGSGRVGGGGVRPIPGQHVGAAHNAPGQAAGSAGYAPVGADDLAADGEPEGEVLAGDYPRGFFAPAAAAPAPVVPNEASIAQLVSMGFTREASAAALAATQNNLTAATNRLLGV